MPPASFSQQRVALPAGLQPDDVAGHQPFERRRGGGPGQQSPGPCARRRTVPPAARQCRCSASTPWILDRASAYAGERDHPRAERAVPRVERSGLQRLGGRIVRQGILDHWPLRKGHAPAIVPVRDPPLSRNLRDSGRRRDQASLTPSVRQALGRPAFQRSLPAAVLVPERFRGPVAPSAAERPSGQAQGQAPLSPAPGGWDSPRMPDPRERAMSD